MDAIASNLLMTAPSIFGAPGDNPYSDAFPPEGLSGDQEHKPDLLAILTHVNQQHERNLLHSIKAAGTDGTPSTLISAQLAVFNHSYFVNATVSVISNLAKSQQRLEQVNG